MVCWTGQATVDCSHTWVERSLRRYHPPATSGTAYPGMRRWICFYHKMPGDMGLIQWAPARPHLQLVSHHLHEKSLPLMNQERYANETWAPTLSDVHCLQCIERATICWMCGITNKTKSACKIFCRGSPGEDAIWWSCKNCLHQMTQMTPPCTA